MFISAATACPLSHSLAEATCYRAIFSVRRQCLSSKDILFHASFIASIHEVYTWLLLLRSKPTGHQMGFSMWTSQNFSKLLLTLLSLVGVLTASSLDLLMEF